MKADDRNFDEAAYPAETPEAGARDYRTTAYEQERAVKWLAERGEKGGLLVDLGVAMGGSVLCARKILRELREAGVIEPVPRKKQRYRLVNWRGDA